MAIKFSQFVVETSASAMSHIVGYDGVDNIQITPNNFFTSFVTGTAGQVPFFGSTTSLLGDNDFSWDNSNKRLGIGTTSPSRTLHVKTDSGVLIKGASGSVNAKISLVPASGGRQYDLGNVGSDFRIFDSSAGVTRMYFDNDGNTGIGTTSPGTTLDVVGTLASSGITQLGTGGSNVLLTSASAGNVGIGSSSPSYKLDIYGDSSSGIVRVKNVANGRDTFRSENAAGTRTLNFGNDGSGNGILIIRGSSGTVTNYITGSGDSYFNGGNVGIGTTNPQSGFKLDVNGNVITRGSVYVLNDLIHYDSSDFNINASNGSTAIKFETGSSERMRIHSNGNIVLGANGNQYGLVTIRQDGTSNDSGLAVVDSSNQKSARLWSDGANVYLSSGATGTGTLVLNEGGGNVGIGTTSPTSKLSISGSQTAIDLTRGTAGDSKWGFSSDSTALYIAELSTGSTDYIMTLKETTGNVGIGTTSPGSKLEISSTSDALLELNGGATANPFMLFAQNGTRRAFIQYVNGGLLSIASEYGDIRFMTGTGGTETEKMRIDSAGNVGIGTTSPSAKLEVAGGADTQAVITGTTTAARLDIKTNSHHRFLQTIESDGRFRLFNQTTNSEQFSVASNNDATFAGRVIIQDTDTESFRINGTSATGSFVRYQTNGTNIGFFGAAYHLIGSSPAGYENDFGIRAESDLRFTIGASEKMSIINNGNVGIGTNTPTAKLTVVGLAEHADNAAAISAGLTTGAFYRTGDLLKVVH